MWCGVVVQGVGGWGETLPPVGHDPPTHSVLYAGRHKQHKRKHKTPLPPVCVMSRQVTSSVLYMAMPTPEPL